MTTAMSAPRGVAARAARSRHASPWMIVEYNLIAARRYWRSVAVVGLVTPLLFTLALGVGLGTVVNRHGTSALGVPYLVFVAPAFLAAAALQVAAGEASYPVMAGFKWLRTFHGMAATPLRPRQICDGTLIWIALRVFLDAIVYLVVMILFGAAQRWQVIFVVPAATLTGIAFGAPVCAVAATVPSESQAFNVLRRFIVTPMFLFAGTFYPISRLPEWGQWLAYVSPLWHGTELARDSSIGGLSALAVVGHIAYLLLWLVVGVALSRWRFRVRLEE